MDKAQLNAFLDYMIGWKSIGTANNEEITTPYCSEMRAFITARLGDNTPGHGYAAMKNPNVDAPLADLLREAADALCPAGWNSPT